jgi:hypothetical protein
MPCLAGASAARRAAAAMSTIASAVACSRVRVIPGGSGRRKAWMAVATVSASRPDSRAWMASIPSSVGDMRPVRRAWRRCSSPMAASWSNWASSRRQVRPKVTGSSRPAASSSTVSAQSRSSPVRCRRVSASSLACCGESSPLLNCSRAWEEVPAAASSPPMRVARLASEGVQASSLVNSWRVARSAWRAALPDSTPRSASRRACRVLSVLASAIWWASIRRRTCSRALRSARS